MAHLGKLGWSFSIVEACLGEHLTQRLANTGHPAFWSSEVLAETPNPAQLASATRTFRQSRQAVVCIGVTLDRGEEKRGFFLSIISPIKERTATRSYGGPPKMANQWAVNLCLDLIHRLKLE